MHLGCFGRIPRNKNVLISDGNQTRIHVVLPFLQHRCPAAVTPGRWMRGGPWLGRGSPCPVVCLGPCRTRCSPLPHHPADRYQRSARLERLVTWTMPVIQVTLCVCLCLCFNRVLVCLALLSRGDTARAKARSRLKTRRR